MFSRLTKSSGDKLTVAKADSERVPANLGVGEVLDEERVDGAVERAAGAADLTTQDPADAAGLDEVADAPDSGGEPALQADDGAGAAGAREVGELGGVRGVVRQRPLDVDVLAGADAGEHGVVVAVDAGGADDELDVRVGGDVLGAPVRPRRRRQPVRRDRLPRRLLARVAQRHDLVPRPPCRREQVRQVRALGPSAPRAREPDDRRPDRCHCCCRLFLGEMRRYCSRDTFFGGSLVVYLG